MNKFSLVYKPINYITKPDNVIFTASFDEYDKSLKDCGPVSDLDSSNKSKVELIVKIMVGIVMRCLNFFSDIVMDLG